MIDTLTTAATVQAVGAELRRDAAVDTIAVTVVALRMVDDVLVQLARTGDRWRLYLQSMSPVPHITCDQWATAVSAPSVEWQRTPDGCLVWCEWTEPTR